MTTRLRTPLRRGPAASRVTTVELFYDLVYVFAVTQISHLLVEHTTPDGGFQAAILLAMVWQIWVYTTWSINYLDPGRSLVRAMLLVLMLASLLLAAALPGAFGRHALLVAILYAGIQVGRALLTLYALRGDVLRMVFVRILPWSTLAGAVLVLGAFTEGHVREVLWVVAIAIELFGASIGFYVPGIGRSATRDWTVNGGHFAERCQAFVLIALGESVVVIGGLADLDHPPWRAVVGLLGAFSGAVMLWWVYFDRAADASAHLIESSRDPGRLARSGFHYVHPVIIAGIIVTAAGDELVLEDPGAHGHAPVAWLVLGGTGLFLAGLVLFAFVVWRTIAWTWAAGVVVLALLGLVAPHVSSLTLGLCSLAVIVCVAIADRIVAPGDESLEADAASLDTDGVELSP